MCLINVSFFDYLLVYNALRLKAFPLHHWKFINQVNVIWQFHLRHFQNFKNCSMRPTLFCQNHFRCNCFTRQTRLAGECLFGKSRTPLAINGWALRLNYKAKKKNPGICNKRERSTTFDCDSGHSLSSNSPKSSTRQHAIHNPRTGRKRAKRSFQKDRRLSPKRRAKLSYKENMSGPDNLPFYNKNI